MTATIETLDTIAREYADQHAELGALDDIEETEEGMLYVFEHGAVMVDHSLQVTVQ